jgi:hypothetical protein
MAGEILIETAAKTSLWICPENPIGFDIEDRIAADKAYQSPKADDPSAGITSAHFMKLAWRLATEKARELDWILKAPLAP